MGKPSPGGAQKPGASRLATARVLAKERSGGAHRYVRLLGLEPRDSATLLAQIRAGLGYRAFEQLRRHLGLSPQAFSILLAIKPGTLARRRQEGRFSAEESDRLLRASRIFAGALDLFEGDAEAARAWLARPAPALGGATPVSIAGTDFGAREVENLIGRLEHGVFS
jgi:putative toxin-antitoxin system antitoxin component (TIGR02293 family)